MDSVNAGCILQSLLCTFDGFAQSLTDFCRDLDFAGLADYDRDSGFSRGAVTVTGGSYTMTMDRARSLPIKAPISTAAKDRRTVGSKSI